MQTMTSYLGLMGRV